MESDQGKLFIGGIPWETSEDRLEEYFGKYGDVLQTVIMRDKNTGRSRGFGFMVFADPSILDRVLEDKHTIDGRMVEAKRALSREEQHVSFRSGSNQNAGRNLSGAGNIRTKKIFVGGLPSTLTEEGFRLYFENYGQVTDAVIMYDQATQRPRGFGFISFETEDAVDRVLHKTFHDLNGKHVEVKRALPKDASPGSAARSSGSYHGYGSSGASANSYDGRIDGNRYMQSQAGGGAFPVYGSSGYGASGYGYGAAAGGIGYGYGAGGYGGANASYNVPPGAYGNPNAPSAGYVGGPPGAPRALWNNQPTSSYGSAGYGGGGAGYGAAAAWSNTVAGASGGAGPASAPAAQSPSGPAGYGYGGYGGGGEGSYGNQGGYGGAGGRGPNASYSSAGTAVGDQQGAGAGYMSGGYGDANGNSGYPNAAWRSDASQGAGHGGTQGNGPSGGQIGYGGYGYPPSWQAQQQ